MDAQWSPDVLGAGFESLTLELAHDDEGPVEATLVAYVPPDAARSGDSPPAGAVLYLHGWSDYFHQRDLASLWRNSGQAFYALDLRKCGRSLRDWQTPGYVSDLSEYDADVDAAIAAIGAHLLDRHGATDAARLTLMGHSTGGLIAVLWANRHPGAVRALVLNSPWLDVAGSSLIRFATVGILDPIVRVRPKATLKLPEFGFYWRSISAQRDGEWDLDPRWRPEFAFPVRAGWLAAILEGHSQVARGLDVQVPILVLSSAASTISPVWQDSMLWTDSVLDVTRMGQRALRLGSHVTVIRLPGALHDVLLSAVPVRQQAYESIRRWSRAYVVPE